MTTQLNQAAAVVATDLLVAVSSSSGAYQTAAVSALQTYLQANMNLNSRVTQASSPNATGFSVTVASSVYSTWLVMTPLAGYATGTIVLPAGPVDGLEVSVTTTNTITALTVSGNGNTILGAPTTLAANGFFAMRFYAATATWYRYR